MAKVYCVVLIGTIFTTPQPPPMTSKTIQANEVRIGNRFIRELRNSRGLEYDHDFILTEEWMGKLFGNDLSIALQDLFPIPLTTEILEKAGFVKVNSNVKNLCRLPFDKYKQLRWSEYDGVCIETMKSGWIWQLEKIKHLHQLQNLYFALTSEELNISLT